MAKRISLLECTLRDGCLGLEDACINGISDIRLSKDERINLLQKIAASNIDIIEIGSLQISDDDRSGFAIYQSVEQASEFIPDNMSEKQQAVALFRGPDTPIDRIPERNDSLVSGLRVILRYSELRKSLDFCAELSQKGYKVYIQPMVTARYSVDQLNMIFDYANNMNAYAVYFVDSYGYFMPEDVVKFASLFDANLKKSIRMGFHAHNNLNMAFANAITFLSFETDRDIIIDSSCTGMGQGAGNLQTELITDYMNRRYFTDYCYDAVLDACDAVEQYNKDSIWGYSVMRSIPATHGVAYKYAVYLRKVLKLPYTEIERLLRILDTLPPEMKHRYSRENVNKLVKLGDE